MKTFQRIWLHLLLFTVILLLKTAVFGQLKAGFTATPRSGCPPLVVSFKDSSIGSPLTWKWDLGNGTISNLQNPTATYFTSGNYNIKLIVTNETESDTLLINKYIAVNGLPVPNFKVSATSGCFPLNVHFTDNSVAGSGIIKAWKWDFGDGNLSDAQNPVHTYTSPGSYTVVLSVTNSNGCSKTISRSSYINIQNGVKADFSYTSPAGCHAPTTVNFTNETIGTGAINYKWDFGNGKTSTDKNPVNTYQNSGVYSVRLIASNSLGCSDTLIKSNAINIGFVKADFTKPDNVCPGADFSLRNTSNPYTFVSSMWTFGDGTFSDSANPSKKYSAPGVYQVKLLTDFGSCRDSITKSINVLPQPATSFSAINNTACGAPLNVTFRNTSGSMTSFLWNFGDTATSTLENPAHVYSKAGSYTVSLTVKNSSGCSGTVTKENFVKTTGPKITAIKNLPVKACLPATAAPVAVISNNFPGSSYLWNFGDGSTSTDSLPSHTYTKPGNYNIKLTITTTAGCTDTLTIIKGAQIGNKPAAQFSANPLEACASTPVDFSDLSTGDTSAQSWKWTFGDGTTSVQQNPVHSYGSTGKFNVTLIVYSFGCSDTLKKLNYITILPPIAKFDTAFRCNDPLVRNFINKSIGATTWQWDFGDGSNSNDSNVTHTYASPGLYTVILKVTNGVCENTSKKDVVVIKERGSLGIGFTESCTNVKQSFSITNVTASNISSYAWYINGLSQPAVVTPNNPFISAYNTAGVRSPVAIVTDKLNCKDTLYATVPVTIYGPKAAFGSSNTGTCFGNSVNFIDSTKTDGIHPLITWIWNYGQGTPQSYTTPPFSYNYSDTGNYTVKLVVKDSYGCTDSISRLSFISVTKPVAGFTVSDTIICPKAPVSFKNTSKGVGATYLWQFGDGLTSNIISPVHTYAESGSFKISLRITDKNGCTDSAFSNIKIATAIAAFDLSDSLSACPPLIETITNKSTNFIKLNWDFGDGGNSQLQNPSHIYTYPGLYTVKLLISSNGGCSDSLTKQIIIKGPTGIFTYVPETACKFDPVNFKLNSQTAINYIWDYNDGTTVFSSAPSQNHTYTTAGTYLPKIIMEDSTGCKVPLQGLDSIKIFGVESYISSDAKVVCDSGFIAFRDSSVSNDKLGTWNWNFGDGNTSSTQSPDHKFANAGFYTITLISKSEFGCADTAVINKYIKVISSPRVKISGDTSACAPTQITFQGEFLQTDTSAITWSWNFGNGNTANIMKPAAQTFTTAGTYPVTLKAVDSDGCYGSVTKQIIVHPTPFVNAGADAAICKAAVYHLGASGADNYMWNADSSLSCTNCATPFAKPAQTITYYVLGKTVFGCTNKDSITVKVQQPFKITVSATDTVCKGESVILKATGADLYQWSPTIWLDNANSATPKSTPDSSIIYTVTAKDSLGCFKDGGSVKLKVYQKSSIEITNGDKIIVSAGSSTKLLTKSSSDVTDWKWYPSKWLSCVSCAEPITTPGDNITYSVSATNNGKCEARDVITVNVICNNASIYIPNTFSPNHDGINDVFYPRGAGVYTVKSFKIFNRWGQMVFSKNDISANDPSYGWDGTLNGALLQADVYVYTAEVMCSNNVILPVQGNVTLVR